MSAYREPWPRRLGRWRRRHRTLVAVAAFVLLTAVVSAAIGIGAVGREQERAQALAQGDALQDASAATVPLLLKDMEPHRAEVLPRLRAKWQDAALTDGQRLRLGLALADDAEVRARLVELARKAEDPQDVLLVRDALAPHAEEMRPLLWGQVKEPGTPPAERFRLLAMLATLDPDGADWPQYAGPAVEEFLGANPLHLGPWKTALEPVPRRPAAAAEPGLPRQQGERSAAADRYPRGRLRGRPARGTRRIADRRGRAAIRRAVPQGAGAPRTGHRLAAPGTRQDAGPRLEGRAARSVVAGAGRGAGAAGGGGGEGLVAERFALCQALPLDQFDALAEGLRKVRLSAGELPAVQHTSPTRKRGCQFSSPPCGRATARPSARHMD